jgi:hypothetical protein
MANERRIAELSTRVASNQAAATVDGGDQRRRDEELESARREARRLPPARCGFWGRWLLGGAGAWPAGKTEPPRKKEPFGDADGGGRERTLTP